MHWMCRLQRVWCVRLRNTCYCRGFEEKRYSETRCVRLRNTCYCRELNTGSRRGQRCVRLKKYLLLQARTQTTWIVGGVWGHKNTCYCREDGKQRQCITGVWGKKYLLLQGLRAHHARGRQVCEVKKYLLLQASKIYQTFLTEVCEVKKYRFLRDFGEIKNSIQETTWYRY